MHQMVIQAHPNRRQVYLGYPDKWNTQVLQTKSLRRQWEKKMNIAAV